LKEGSKRKKYYLIVFWSLLSNCLLVTWIIFRGATT